MQIMFFFFYHEKKNQYIFIFRLYKFFLINHKTIEKTSNELRRCSVESKANSCSSLESLWRPLIEKDQIKKKNI